MLNYGHIKGQKIENKTSKTIVLLSFCHFVHKQKLLDNMNKSKETKMRVETVDVMEQITIIGFTHTVGL